MTPPPHFSEEKQALGGNLSEMSLLGDGEGRALIATLPSFSLTSTSLKLTGTVDTHQPRGRGGKRPQGPSGRHETRDGARWASK